MLYVNLKNKKHYYYQIQGRDEHAGRLLINMFWGMLK